jgi:hypothetical protein
VTPSQRYSSTLLAAAAACVIASSTPARAQIMYPFPPYGYPNIHPDASVHLDVTPQDAEVYVDGYYAGIVDDFDGMLQRLHVEPGQHEIVLYRDGLRTVHQRVYLTRDRTFKIKMQMEPLGAGEAAEPRPIPPPLPPGATAPTGTRQPRPLPRNGRTPPPNGPTPNAPPAGAPPGAQSAPGRLTLHVQPADATVLIDGQPATSQGQDTLVLDVSEGRHVIQVRKTGYVGYLSEVEVRRGETTTLDVTLRAQP